MLQKSTHNFVNSFVLQNNFTNDHIQGNPHSLLYRPIKYIFVTILILLGISHVVVKLFQLAKGIGLRPWLGSLYCDPHYPQVVGVG